MELVFQVLFTAGKRRTPGAHTKRRFTKRQFTKRRQQNVGLQNVDGN
jgi:hypothetical protein